MRKILLILLILSTGGLPAFAQDKNTTDSKPVVPYVGVMAGGCVDNPFSFTAGVQKNLKTRIAVSFDLHYWNTRYECYCDSMYSQGRFRSFTPSVKLTFNTGKREGMGLVVGVGLGYMFAKDRGTEQAYSYDVSTNTNVLNTKDKANGNWDFNSIAPTFTVGVGFRVLKVPVSFQSEYYFAKTTEGWMAAAGGVGFKIGIRRYK